MHILPTDEEYRWLAKQRPHHKRQNRILLLNAKRKQRAAMAVTVVAQVKN